MTRQRHVFLALAFVARWYGAGALSKRQDSSRPSSRPTATDASHDGTDVSFAEGLGQSLGYAIAQRWEQCKPISKTVPHFIDTLASSSHRFFYVDNVKAASSSVQLMVSNALNLTMNATDMPHARQTGRCCGRPSSGDFSLEDVSSTFRFSVVRDPVKKFQSGVVEAWAHNSAMTNFTADELLDKTLAHFSEMQKFPNEHLQPSSWRLSSFVGDWPVHLDFIGKVETFDRDWPMIVRSFSNLTNAQRQHLLQVTAANVRESHPRATLSEAGIRKMCASELYGQEWDCFGYDLPEVCKRDRDFS